MSAAARLTRHTLAEGERWLRARDRRLARWMDRVGPVSLRRSRHHFDALCRSIIAQQLSARAARTIRARLLREFAPARAPDPAGLLALPEGRLRACGLSAPKIRYLRGVAREFEGGTLRGRRLGSLPDAEVIGLLTALPGVGLWTAEMFLIFALGRRDVFSVRDLALRAGVQRVIGRPLEPAGIERAARRWSPWRSVASLYLWRIAHWRESGEE